MVSEWDVSWEIGLGRSGDAKLLLFVAVSCVPLLPEGRRFDSGPSRE